MPAMVAAVEVSGLKKNYAEFEALKGLDFEVRAGEVFALLGPNGAGKTTTVEILEGVRARSAGVVQVLGFDPSVQSIELRDRIGVCLQATNLPDKIKVREAIALFGTLYSRKVAEEPLLRRLHLWDLREQYFATLSGGQRQRLALALALLNEPQLVFLDEPTAALDPQARLDIQSLVEELRAERRTVLLTTHYIEEAERLCDRVAIIDGGRIIAMGTPAELRRKTARPKVIEVACAAGLPGGDLPSWSGAESAQVSEDRTRVSVTSQTPAKTLVELLSFIDQQGVEVTDVALKQPSLEDIFIELTGRSLRE
jgi:ABC-2 type transport system ATP-binding protein